jgi:hypothetical protein
MMQISANYGHNIKQQIKDSIQSIDERFYLFITDVSLTQLELYHLLYYFDDKLEHFFYIDHHQAVYSDIKHEKLTILHNVERSSTGIFFKHFIKNNSSISKHDKIKARILSDLIDVYDLNKVKDNKFYQSTIINDVCMAEWCNPFDDNNVLNIPYRMIAIEYALNMFVENETFIHMVTKLDEKRLSFLKSNGYSLKDNDDIYDCLSLANPLYHESVNPYLFIESIKMNEAFLKVSTKIKQKNLKNLLSHVNIFSAPRRMQTLKYLSDRFGDNSNFLRELHKLNTTSVTVKNNICVLKNEKQMLFHSIAHLLIKDRDIHVLCNILPNGRISIRTSLPIANTIAENLFSGGGHLREAGGECHMSVKEVQRSISKFLDNKR